MKTFPLFLAVVLHTTLVSGAALAAESGLKVLDQAAAPRVADRKPQDASEHFTADVGEVVAFVNLANPGAPTEVHQRWTHDGKVRFDARLNVGTTKTGWRTWSRHRMSPKGGKDVGAWTVETVAADGSVLGTLNFDVAASTAAVTPAPKPIARAD